MDSFTEKMLERARARQKKLDEHYNIAGETPKKPFQRTNSLINKLETRSQPNLSESEKTPIKKDIASDSNIYKKSLRDSEFKENLSETSLLKTTKVLSETSISPTKTLNIQQDNFNMEIKLTSTDNVRVEVEIEERDESDIEGESVDKPVIREDAKKRLQRLGKLYSGVDDLGLSSPIHRTEGRFEQEEVGEKETTKSTCGLGKLKALANTVKEWEDELPNPSNKTSKKETPKKSWKPPAPKPPQTTTSKTKYPAPKPPEIISKPLSREASPEKIVSEKSSPKKTPSSPKKAPSSPKKVPPSPKKTPSSPEKSSKTETKQLAWDQAVIETLESQGFTRTNSNARLVYNYKEINQEETINEENEKDEPVATVSKLASKFDEQTTPEAPKSPQFKSRSPTKTEIFNKMAMFEKASPSKKDPALLSVSERKALFEKNKGTALIPKAAFAMAIPIKKSEKENMKVKPASPVKSTSPARAQSSPAKQKVDSPATVGIKQSGGIASKMRALLEKKPTISQTQIDSGTKQQRQKEMNLLLNRYNNQKEEGEIQEVEEETESETDEEDLSETTKMIAFRAAKIVQFKGSNVELSPPPPPPLPPAVKITAAKRRSKGDSPKVREVLEDVKRIRVSPPKVGRMYPNLSDIEAGTETEEASTAEPSPDTSYEGNSSNADSDGPNTSFGREILEVVCKNQTPHKRPILDESTASDISSFLDDMDDYLDEALVEDDSENTHGPTPPKQGKRTNLTAPSNSFHYKNCTPTQNNPSSNESAEDTPTHVIDEGTVLPLTHSVSFYRKQQAQQVCTPLRKIQRQPALEEESPPCKNKSDEALAVQNKIEELLSNVGKQQTVISQASQALNLCISTIEFSGSSEQVEAEKLLLVATQRRQAALHEVQRLRVEGTLHSGGGTCSEKGTITISDICLPLKKEYARALSSTGGLGHHVMCLLRYAEHVVPTRLASTQASPRENLDIFIDIPGIVKLQDVYSDFTATIEVYTLQAHEELLPHEVKYHITSKKNPKLTPKKLKDSKLIMPTVQSPAGPQAVRSPSFQLMGYVVFSLAGINRTQWTLNNTPPMSPLEGSIQMKIKCELTLSVEHRGFLSMFDDVSGFGAWHRRWCLLKGSYISYWKYPDDEKKKAPIDSINLQSCITKQVSQVTREICARPHTFLLETVRPAKSTDTDSLVTVCKGDKTIIRHLLSADTKEERIQWCEELNKALKTIRLIDNASKM